ncbi:MAG: hypothetical protein AVDCRST_MAG38-2119, partial [uncultured Solirubrobacteraceae bacterium]
AGRRCPRTVAARIRAPPTRMAAGVASRRRHAGGDLQRGAGQRQDHLLRRALPRHASADLDGSDGHAPPRAPLPGDLPGDGAALRRRQHQSQRGRAGALRAGCPGRALRGRRLRVQDFGGRRPEAQRAPCAAGAHTRRRAAGDLRATGAAAGPRGLRARPRGRDRRARWLRGLRANRGRKRL